MAESEVAIIGGGAWGTALSVHLGRRGRAVRLWMREDDLVTRMLERRDNPAYLPGVRIPDTVVPTSDLAAVLDGAEVVLCVVPSLHARDVYRRMAPSLAADAALIITTKGIEEDSLELPLEVAASELGGGGRLAVLSGPSFAREVAQGHPTAVVVAALDPELAGRLQRTISSREFRVYTNQDPIGVQVAGALKNVIAIAVGIADSLRLGTNARAGLITRGLAEMSRLVLALGGAASTTAGLAGLGDLVLTCTGELSRNLRVGRRLGRGERLQDILARSRSVAEGVRTAIAVRALAGRAGVEMPIVEEVHRILHEDGRPQAGLDRLLSRPLTSEEGSVKTTGA